MNELTICLLVFLLLGFFQDFLHIGDIMLKLLTEIYLYYIKVIKTHFK
ncbi:MAG: hypothetical protein UZ09_BCD002001568 [Bacteroidetes bacterium OLB9]|nr:MAG: hypothetical protein UZ09_BCD002001568 [Bacteroidetes bacterium OLB9]